MLSRWSHLASSCGVIYHSVSCLVRGTLRIRKVDRSDIDGSARCIEASAKRYLAAERNDVPPAIKERRRSSAVERKARRRSRSDGDILARLVVSGPDHPSIVGIDMELSAKRLLNARHDRVGACSFIHSRVAAAGHKDQSPR